LRELIVSENDKEGQKGYLLRSVRMDTKKKEAGMKILNQFTGYIYKLNRIILINVL
jgi:hypothetical protein